MSNLIAQPHFILAVQKNLIAYDEGDGVFQAMLNVVYDLWTKDVKSFGALLDKANATYGGVAVLATLLGKYNQQVTNGGHQQWFDNGYAGDGLDSPDIENHDRMVDLLVQSQLSTTKIGKVVYDNARQMRISEDPEDDDLGPGSAGFFVVNADVLDEKYYSVCEEWEKFLEGFFAGLISPEAT